LQDQADEDKYLDEQAKKRKAVSDLEIQLAQLEFDNSAKAQKKRLELQQQLADAQKELADFEKDHALDVTQKKLDELENLQEEGINAQIKQVDDALHDEGTIYQQAVEDMKDIDQRMLNEMIDYNNRYGTGNPEDVVDMWNEAYTALQQYQELYNSLYKGMYMSYGTDLRDPIVNIASVTTGRRSVVKNPNTSKNSVSGSVSSSASGKLPKIRVPKKNVGTEAYPIVPHAYVESNMGTISSSAKGGTIDIDGNSYKLLSMDSRSIDTLTATPQDVLNGLIGSISSNTNVNTTPTQNVVNMGNIVINGNATEKTVSEIRREQRESIDLMLKRLNKLS
jgi:hypothetical protein